MDNDLQNQPTTPEPATAQPPATPVTTIPVSSAPAPTTPSDSTVPSTITPSAKNPALNIIRVLAGVVALVIIAGSIWALVQSTAKPTTPRIKVGVMMAFSGGSSSMGYGAMKGVQLAKKQLGADNIQIVQVDSKCDAKTAAGAVKDLIDQKVVAIIGEGCSSATVAALPAVNNAKIPLISPSASSTVLSTPNDYFFRVVPPDTFQGSFMAKTIYNQGIRNVAVFYTNEPYGSSMNTVFREKFEELGGKVVATASAEPDVIDLAGQAQTLKAANPEALFIAPNSVVSATAIMKLTREAGMKAPFFGADIMYDNTIISNNPAIAEGLTISSFYTGTKSFKQALYNEGVKTEQLYAAPQAYDIIHVLQVATQMGANTGERIKNILPDITIEGVSGFAKFDAKGEVSDPSYKYDLFTVKNGKFSIAEQ
ncbi:MAG TPA: penicillin-binding protein activator [Candidatus Saccharimonadales bacterium]